MAQSVRRRIKRGHLRMIWNTTFNRMDFFRRTSNGRFILCAPFVGKDLSQGLGHHSKTLDSWENKAAA